MNSLYLITLIGRSFFYLQFVTLKRWDWGRGRVSVSWSVHDYRPVWKRYNRRAYIVIVIWLVLLIFCYHNQPHYYRYLRVCAITCLHPSHTRKTVQLPGSSRSYKLIKIHNKYRKEIIFVADNNNKTFMRQ